MEAKTNVMIDLETLSIGKKPVILSIGAVAFNETDTIENIVSLPSFYRVISLNSYRMYLRDHRFEFDPDTIKFWISQDPESIKENFFNQNETVINIAYQQFYSFLTSMMVMDGDSKIWANGIKQDLVWIENLFNALGTEYPFRFFQEMDFRTVRNLNGKNFDPILNIPEERHNALYDARWQTGYLLNYFKQNKRDA